MEHHNSANSKCRLASCYGNIRDGISIPALAKNSLESRFLVSETSSNVFKGRSVTGTFQLFSRLESIKNGTFSGNSFASSLTVPESVSHIGGAALEYAGFIGTLALSNALAPTEGQALCSCGFKGLNLLEGLISIGITSSGHYAGASDVSYLLESITKIDDSAFYGCNSLEAIYPGRNVKELGRKVFPESTPLHTNSSQA